MCFNEPFIDRSIHLHFMVEMQSVQKKEEKYKEIISKFLLACISGFDGMICFKFGMVVQ